MFINLNNVIEFIGNFWHKVVNIHKCQYIVYERKKLCILYHVGISG